jgi:hypothetical protein
MSKLAGMMRLLLEPGKDLVWQAAREALWAAMIHSAYRKAGREPPEIKIPRLTNCPYHEILVMYDLDPADDHIAPDFDRIDALIRELRDLFGEAAIVRTKRQTGRWDKVALNDLICELRRVQVPNRRAKPGLSDAEIALVLIAADFENKGTSPYSLERVKDIVYQHT